LLWRSFVRVYSKAQVSLRETLDQPPAPPDEVRLSPLAGLLEKAELAPVIIHERSHANGRLIRELQLRTTTGASIVGIERAGATTVNPGPDEELLAGDKVLLLGQSGQLEAARSLLGAPGRIREPPLASSE
jgi:CPA2 family monovalent cation:H+ antiporter-2